MRRREQTPIAGTVTLPREGADTELNRPADPADISSMPITSSVVQEVLAPADLRHVDALTLLPTRATLLDRIAERTATADSAPAALVLIGLLRRDTGWPMPGSELVRFAGALSADLRGSD